MDASLRNAEPARQSGTRSLDTVDRIRRVFVESLNLNVSPRDLDYERKLDEFAGLDSLAVIEFVTALETEFEITIEPEWLRLDFIRDLSQIASYIEDRAARVPPSAV